MTGTLQRLHPLSPVAVTASQGRVLAPSALAGVAGNEWWIALATLAVTLGLVWFAHRFRTWAFDGRRVTYRSGWLNRSVRTLDVDRVQQVDLHQNIVHRMLGLVDVRIESASGARGADIALQCLDEEGGRSLRARILAARDAGPAVVGADDPEVDSGAAVGVQPGPAGPAPAPSALLASMTTGQAALAGLSDAQPLALALTLAPLAVPVVERLARGRGALVVAALAVAAVAAYLVYAAGWGMLRWGEFALTLGERDIAARYGLMSTRDEATPRHRVQAVALQENLVRRPLGFAEVRIRAAGAAGQESTTRLTAPFLRRDDAIDALAALWPDAIDIGPMAPAPPAALHRARFRWTAPALLLAAVASVVAAVTGVWPVLAIWLTVPAGWWFGGRVHRALGHVFGGGYLVAREGPLNRVTQIVPAAKAQTVRVRTTPFQRRWALADLLVDVAGTGAVRVRELPFERAAELAAAINGGRPAPRSPAA